MRRENEEVVERQHNKQRFELFTPMKVAGGPRNATTVGSVRVTVGEYADKRKLLKMDRWKTEVEPHQRMEQPWTGTTFFLED